MFKKLSVLVACLALAASAALYSASSEAGTDWYFVSVCSSASPSDCAFGSQVFWFGPFSTAAQCDTAAAITAGGIFGQPPRTVSSCFQY